MTELWSPTEEPLVLHVIPTPRARGAQREARGLADQLDRPGVRAHRVLSLFEGPSEVDVDFSLNYFGGEAPAVGFDPRLVLRLRTALGTLDPSVVVAHGGDPLKYLVPAMVGRRRPLAYYAIGTFASTRQSVMQVQLWRILLRRVDQVAAEGDEVAEECTTLLRVPQRKITMTPNGRDPDVFRPRSAARAETTPPAGDVPLVTFVGALTDGKQPMRFIEAVTELRARGADLRARLVGDGPLRDDVVVPAKRADVELLGSRGDVADLLRESDLFVFPSLPTGEGMPGVLIEAGLSGLPVIATDVPGVRTVVHDGTTGRIVPVDDFNGLVDAVHSLLEDPAARAAMGQAARERCVSRFSLDQVAAQWSSILDPLLEHSPTPSG